MSWFNELMNRGAKEGISKSHPKKTKIIAVADQTETVAINVDFIYSENLFYDLLFGKESSSENIANDLELKIVDDVTQLLNNPNNVIFEPFPKPLKDALDLIDREASMIEMEVCLQQDPKLASEIVRLANSPAFKCSRQQIISLKTAINFVGIDSLKRIVITASLSSMMKVCPIYFKLFGEKTWFHSLNTANICKELALIQHQDPDVAFFIGLIHDVGKIAIFNALVNQIKSTIPGSQPGSLYFRKLMTNMSKQLSVTIVKTWQLPELVAETLEQYCYYGERENLEPLTNILAEGKLISEVSLLLKYQLIDQLDAETILINHDIDIDKLSLAIY